MGPGGTLPNDLKSKKGKEEEKMKMKMKNEKMKKSKNEGRKLRMIQIEKDFNQLNWETREAREEQTFSARTPVAAFPGRLGLLAYILLWSP